MNRRGCTVAGHLSHMMLSAAVEDYLKTIYKLQSGGTVSKIRIARALGVTPASVTNMVQRLARLKMVEHELYGGVSLTEAGEKIALEIVRHHRLLETYLKECLGYSWAEMHAEAEHLEHHISEEFEKRIDKLLGYPTHDPHGHPIPSADLILDKASVTPLTAVSVGRCVRVHSVSDKDADMLEYLESIGLMPDTMVTVDFKAPFNGPLTVTVDSGQFVVGNHAASQVYVEKDELQDRLSQQ